MSEVYVMVTICSRKNMPRFVDCYKDYNVEAANISLGRGTASSDVLDLLGLEDDEKWYPYVTCYRGYMEEC